MHGVVIGARLVGHVLVAMFKLSVSARHWSAAQRRMEIAAWARKVFDLLGVKLIAHGAPEHTINGQLYAGNHVSWLDIFALLATIDVRFVAKAEVRDWPVMGWLATQLGTHFIARSNRCEAYAGAQVVAALLNAGDNVCIFPEGSTTDGSHVRPFRAALFEAAARGASGVRPFAIRYRDHAGRRSEAAAFIDDMNMADSFRLLLNARDLTCELTIMEEIATAKLSRRQMAWATERRVADQLGVEVRLGRVARTVPRVDALPVLLSA